MDFAAAVPRHRLLNPRLPTSAGLEEEQIEAERRLFARRQKLERLFSDHLIQPRVPCRQTQSALLVRLPELVAAMWTLKKWGLPRYLIRYIVFHTDLYLFYFHAESEALRSQRLEIYKMFSECSDYNNLMKCILWETRFLHLELGRLKTKHDKDYRHTTHQLPASRCSHQGVWIRVGVPKAGSPSGE